MDSLIRQLNKVYFWDVDFNEIDKDKSMSLIIERVISMGNLNDLKILRQLYSDHEIKQTLTHLSYLDAKTLNFLFLIFNIPKAKFKCYTKRQSVAAHWTY